MEEENTHIIENSNINNLANKIEILIQEARQHIVSSVNTAMVYTYYEIGRYIVEDEQNGQNRAEYGKSVLKKLSAYLTPKFGKGFSVENFDRMRYFYKVYSTQSIEYQQDLNSSTLLTNLQFGLSWSHYLKLMRISNPEERRFYEIEAIENKWSLRELERQFDSSLYERLALSRNKEEVELGKGFAFVGRQVRLSFSEEHFFVDLVFYNRLLKCFVLIDLKRGKLKHQDIGQMQMYVNYYDREVKLEDENSTIGLLLCADKDNAIVEYTLPKDNNQIFAAKYATILPSKEQLQQLILEKR